MSPKCVRRWVGRHNDGAGLARKRGAGRKPMLTDKAAERAMELIMESGPAEAAKGLVHEGHAILPPSKVTVIRTARRVATQQGRRLHACRSQPMRRLTQWTKQQRMQFCKKNRDTSWGHVMFTDRKKFHFSYPGEKVKPTQWLLDGQKRLARQVNHPSCVNVYGGITRYGVTKLVVVAGSSKHKSKHLNKKGQPATNITKGEYKEVLLYSLLPEGRRLFTSAGLGTWVLQQDNDPAHGGAGDVMKGWRHGGVSLLPNWPPNSPDLSPIENLWGWVQARVQARGCKTFEDYKAAVEEVWLGVPVSMCENLIKSMPNRIKECIKNAGDKTPH